MKVVVQSALKSVEYSQKLRGFCVCFFLNKILRNLKVILVHLPDRKMGFIPKGHNKCMGDDHHEEAKCSYRTGSEGLQPRTSTSHPALMRCSQLDPSTHGTVCLCCWCEVTVLFPRNAGFPPPLITHFRR